MKVRAISSLAWNKWSKLGMVASGMQGDLRPWTESALRPEAKGKVMSSMPKSSDVSVLPVLQGTIFSTLAGEKSSSDYKKVRGRHAENCSVMSEDWLLQDWWHLIEKLCVISEDGLMAYCEQLLGYECKAHFQDAGTSAVVWQMFGAERHWLHLFPYCYSLVFSYTRWVTREFRPILYTALRASVSLGANIKLVNWSSTWQQNDFEFWKLVI